MTAIVHTDQQLLAMLAQDSRNAFEAIYDRYWEAMFNAAYKRLKDKELCRDIVQDVFTDLWMRRNQVSINHLKAYLLTAVRFQVYKLAAREKAGSSFYELYETLAASACQAEEQVMEKEFFYFVKAWIDVLPEKRRKMLLLHTEEELSTREIARELALSQKTVQNQLGATIQRLRMHIASFFMSLLIGFLLLLL